MPKTERQKRIARLHDKRPRPTKKKRSNVRILNAEALLPVLNLVIDGERQRMTMLQMFIDRFLVASLASSKLLERQVAALEKLATVHDAKIREEVRTRCVALVDRHADLDPDFSALADSMRSMPL